MNKFHDIQHIRKQIKLDSTWFRTLCKLEKDKICVSTITIYIRIANGFAPGSKSRFRVATDSLGSKISCANWQRFEYMATYGSICDHMVAGGQLINVAQENFCKTS